MALTDEFNNVESHREATSEYDDSASGEESLKSKLLSIQSKVVLKEDDIDIEDIVTSDFKKVSRQKTISGLSSLIADWGIVSPIHVLKLEDDDSYLLLDGLRRIYATLSKGESKARAIIWEFSDVDEGKNIAPIISLMINRTQSYSNKEQWGLMQILLSRATSPGLIEFLLQLPAGDAMRLQDIMTADTAGFDEFREKFLADEINLDTAYKKLQKCRKDENSLEKEDRTVITGTEESGMDVAQSEKRTLGSDEVLELLDMLDSDGSESDDVNPSDIDMTDKVNAPTEEERGKRNDEPLDPLIKQEVFRRDKFTCQCCGLSGEDNAANIAVLVFHHIVGRACGGGNSVKNGLTLCQNCHMLLHLYVFGKIHIEWEQLDEEGTKKFKNICKYGNIQIKAWKKIGVRKEDAYKQDADSRRHLYPGEGLKDLNQAYETAKAEGEI